MLPHTYRSKCHDHIHENSSLLPDLWGEHKEWLSSGNQIFLVFNIDKNAYRHKRTTYRFRLQYETGTCAIVHAG